VTSEWMHLLYFVTTLPNLRQSGCDCLFNIVAKKQLPQVKFDTVTAVGIVNALPRIVGMVPVVSSDEEEAFMVSVVSLTNGLAEQLLACTDAGIAGAAEALHLVVAEVLRLFSIAHFQVRELTLPFVQLYIKSSALGDNEAGELLHLLYRHTIISPSDWLPQQPDDVIDQRKTLHNLMRLMHRRFPQLVLDHCSRVVFQVVSVSSPTELPNIEAEGAMRYLYELGELVRMDVVLKDSNSPFASMIYHLLNCASISGHPDPLVHLAYFELMDRYSQFFVHHRDQVAILLQQLLLMPCGITNGQHRVRSRICYLCSHMLQALKVQCVPHAGHIVSAMKDVFDRAALVTSDKLDLYEGIGTVMSVSDINMCVEVAERVLLHMDALANSRASSDAEAAAVEVADDIAYLSHLAKGIAGTDATKVPDSPPLVAKRDDASSVGASGFPLTLPPITPTDSSQPPLQVFWTVTLGVMRSVEHWSGSVLVRDRACLFMHQMVNILPHTSLCDVFEAFVKNMLQWASAANELPKILRVVYQYVNRTRAASVAVVARLIPCLHERVALMCTNVQNIRSELGVVSEFVKEQAEGYRSYFAVLHAVSHCGCLPALFVEPALPVFGSILQLLVGAVYVSAEFDIPKQALQIMSRLVSQSSSQPEIPGPALFAFMNDTAIPLMLDAFTVQGFDMKDAKNFFLISEFCQMVKALVTIVGDTALQAVYQVLTSAALQTSGDEAMAVCTRLRDDPRATAQFKSSFRQLLESAQSRRWSHMLTPVVAC
jgi:exportin-T